MLEKLTEHARKQVEISEKQKALEAAALLKQAEIDAGNTMAELVKSVMKVRCDDDDMVQNIEDVVPNIREAITVATEIEISKNKKIAIWT